MESEIKLTQLDINSDSSTPHNTSVENVVPLSALEKSLDTLVQQHIDTQIKMAQLKGLPYTVTNRETGTVSIVQGGKVIKQRKLRGVI